MFPENLNKTLEISSFHLLTSKCKKNVDYDQSKNFPPELVCNGSLEIKYYFHFSGSIWFRKDLIWKFFESCLKLKKNKTTELGVICWEKKFTGWLFHM